MDDGKHIIDAHEAATRLRNVMARLRMKATRSSAPEHREDVGEVFDEEELIVERQIEQLMRLAVGEAASA